MLIETVYHYRTSLASPAVYHYKYCTSQPGISATTPSNTHRKHYEELSTAIILETNLPRSYKMAPPVPNDGKAPQELQFIHFDTEKAKKKDTMKQALRSREEQGETSGDNAVEKWLKETKPDASQPTANSASDVALADVGINHLTLAAEIARLEQLKKQ